MTTTTTDNQVFPEVERVFYAKAPLIEVICQVRFPVDLRLETEPPADFQLRVRNNFPLLKESTQLKQSTQAVFGNLPPDMAKAIESFASHAGATRTWQFSTEDSGTGLELTKENLTLSTKNYRHWQDFFSLFEHALDALIEIYKPSFFVRAGLRYQDLIRRSDIGLKDRPWNELLTKHVLGELAVDDIGERAVEARRTLRLKLPEHDAQVRLQHGFAETEGNKETCYLIDCDFYSGRTEINNARATMEYLHAQAAKYFRGCITDRLHNALEPGPFPD